MAKESMIKRIFIAGAAAALDYREKHPHASESEVMSYVTRQMGRLIGDIERDK